MPSHRPLSHVGVKVVLCSNEVLDEVANAAEGDPDAAEIDFLAFGEFVYAGDDPRVAAEDWMVVLAPLILPRSPNARISRTSPSSSLSAPSVGPGWWISSPHTATTWTPRRSVRSAANTVLLADALYDRTPAHVSYETAILAPDEALAVLTFAVPGFNHTELSVRQASGMVRPVSSGEDTFATTNSKTRLVAQLDRNSAELIRATIAASLAAVQAVVHGHVVATAASWLAGDHLYCLEEQRPGSSAPGFRSRPRWPGAACYVRRDGLEVRDLLVTNAEYAAFLNAMADAGMPNHHGGVYLLACPRCRTSAAAGCIRTRPPAGGRSAPGSKTIPSTG